MGTCNFNQKNATKIFAVTIETEFDYDDTVDNLNYTLAEMSDTIETDDTLKHHLYSQKCYKDFEVEITLKPTIEGGYYEGANLDYDVSIEIGGTEFDISGIYGYTKENIITELSYDFSKKKATYYTGLIMTWIKKEYPKMQKELEGVFELYSDTLEVMARFGNGEVLYIQA